MTSIALLTPAKVNLGLWVVGRREDGYHRLVSLFLRIPLYDFLEITLRPEGFALESTPSLPEDNTLRRAWRVWGAPPGLSLRLVKGVPTGAGLGGGSADAAGLLWALNHLMGYPRSFRELLHLGERVGADVPFFLHRTECALVQGVGEQVTPLPWRFPEAWRLYLAVPDCPFITREMYARLSPEKDWVKEEAARTRIRAFIEGLSRGEPAAFRHLENVFFPYAIRICQNLRQLVDRLRDRGARWISLTGTGSGILALFDRPVNLRSDDLDIPDVRLYLISPPPIHPLLPRGVPPSLPGVLIF